MNNLPILHSSALTMYTVFEYEKIRNELQKLLSDFDIKKTKLLPIVVGPNGDKFGILQTVMAAYADYTSEYEDILRRKERPSKGMIDRLNHIKQNREEADQLEKACKAIYKKIASKIHPDKLTEKDSVLEIFFQQARTYAESLDIEALEQLSEDVFSYLSGVLGQPVPKTDKVPASDSIALKLASLKQQIRLLETEHHNLQFDEFGKVMQVYDSQGEMIAIIFYDKVLDAQLSHYRLKTTEIKEMIRKESHNFTEFNVNSKSKFTFEE